MSQFDFGAIDPDNTDGTELAAILGQWRDALHSSHKGPAAPTYAQEGMGWIDDSATPWVLKRCTAVTPGVAWVVMGTIDPAGPTFAPAGHGHPIGDVAELAVTLAALAAALDGKAAASHTHAQDDVANLATDLAARLSIALDPALSGSDHSSSGHTVSLTAGEVLVFGEVCCIKSDGKLWKADADAAATMPVLFMAAAGINQDEVGPFVMPGSFVRDDSWDWTAGGAVYAGTDAGGLTQTVPDGSGDQVQRVGFAIHAHRMLFAPSLDVLEVA